MRDNLASFKRYQVFLNYPFDEAFERLSNAMHFAVVAGGLVPVCAKDLSTPDHLRLEMLVDAIGNSSYSVHDFSRYQGEGDGNLARFNMPIEFGISLCYALVHRKQHRFAFVVTSADYQKFASDLAGLDPLKYGDELSMVARVYEWLRDVVGSNFFTGPPTIEVQEGFKEFSAKLKKVRGSGADGRAGHHEAQELMYLLCSQWEWWDFRATKSGRDEFPALRLSWKK
jgi:hypothetical protein